ncbi:MAG: redoxin domain-containing protein [Paracoccaceae bacterium]
MLIPGQKAPEIELETTQSGSFSLHHDAPENGTIVIFYRGLHCPICIRQLTDLERHLDDFAAIGLRVMAISGDDREKTLATANKAGVQNLVLGYGMNLQSARSDWGLLISAGRENTAEPPFFHEPGLFWVRQDGTLWLELVQSMPFVRPTTRDLLAGLNYILQNDYPLRGNYSGVLD